MRIHLWRLTGWRRKEGERKAKAPKVENRVRVKTKTKVRAKERMALSRRAKERKVMEKAKPTVLYGKGKGQGQQSQSEVKCFRCNGRGHYAKDCTVRMVAEDGGQVQEAPQASPSSRTSLPSNSTTASSQHRVARIQEQPVVSSSPLVFDMRGGCLDRIDEVRVINYYAGEDESFEEGKVRAVTEELDTEELEEETPMTTIILDSGADAPVFRGDWLHHGARVQCEDGKRLQDAQGNLIPTLGKH